MGTSIWRVKIDWDNDGNFTGDYDDISADVRFVEWWVGLRNPYQDVADEIEATIQLDNPDRKYTPENEASPLHDKLLPNRDIIIEAVIGGTATRMWTGKVETIQVVWGGPGPQSAQLEAVIEGRGFKRQLDNLQVPVEQQAGVTFDTIITDVLDAASLPTTGLETGITTFTTYSNTADQSGFSIIQEVVQAERGRYFVGRDGVAQAWNRHHLLTSSAIALDATARSDSGPYRPAGVEYVFGYLLNNSVRIQLNPRQTGNSETLWELDETITTRAGKTKTIEIILRKSTGQFATSTALTVSGETFSSGTATVTAVAKGGRADLTIDNSGGSVDAVLTDATVSGAPTVAQHAAVVTAEDSSGITTYGKQQLDINMSQLSDYDDSENVAEFELSRRKTPRGDVLSLTFINPSDGQANEHQVTWAIGDFINVILPELDHDRNYFIIGETHRVDIATRELHETTFFLEPANATRFWILGEAGYSELGETTILAY